MKYIKSYRLFESGSSGILELLELGLISLDDLPELISGLNKPDKIVLANALIKRYGTDEKLKLSLIKLIKRAYQDNFSEFLNQFSNLTPVEISNKIYYVDTDNSPLFFYYPDKKNGDVWIDYDMIWSFFSNVMGFGHDKIRDILKQWLKKTYGITDLTPKSYRWLYQIGVERDL